MLKQLRELKQGAKEIEDYLLEFENLRNLAKISKDHAMEILQQNIKWTLLEKTVIQYGPPADYDNLTALLTMVGTAEQYLAKIWNPTNTSQPLSWPPFTPVSSKPLHPGVPMDVDRKKYPGVSTRPRVAAMGVCYNC